jgi:hypothetical protein
MAMVVVDLFIQSSAIVVTRLAGVVKHSARRITGKTIFRYFFVNMASEVVLKVGTRVLLRFYSFG